MVVVRSAGSGSRPKKLYGVNMVTFVWRRQWQPSKVAVGSRGGYRLWRRQWQPSKVAVEGEHGYFCVAPAVAAV